MSPHVIKRRGNGRTSMSDVLSRMRNAETHPNILQMGIVDIMKTFDLTHLRALKVKENVIAGLVSNGETDVLRESFEKKHFSRVRKRIIRAEKKYKFVFRKLLSERNKSAVAQSYGFSREYARQLVKQFMDLHEHMRCPLGKILDDIETAAAHTDFHKKKRVK